jgi:hypothetical protein
MSDDVDRLAKAIAPAIGAARFGELFAGAIVAAFTDRLVRREEAAAIFSISPRAFDQDERPYLPWVPLGRPAGKRTTKAWRLSDLYARMEAKKRRPGSG